MPQTEPALLTGKTALWLLMLTVIILFGTLTYTFVASIPADLAFNVPLLFYGNTILLLASSVAMHFGMIQNEMSKSRSWVLVALIIGSLFLIAQLGVWYQMSAQGLTLARGGRVSSYLYVLSGLHGLHIIGGLIFIWVVYRGLIKAQNQYLEMASWFWHFLGILWIFLLAVFALNT